MKTPAILRAAIERRASTWSDPRQADRLRQLAAQTATIVDFGPTIRHL